MASRPKRARIKQRGEFIGKGCFIQALGLAAPVAGGLLLGLYGFVAGLVALVPLYFIGVWHSTRLECGRCGSRLTAWSVKECPVCGAELD